MTPRIDRIQLNEYLNEGKSQADCAKIFNVSEAGISKAVRRFNLTVAQDVATKQASELEDKKKNAMDRLMDLVGKCEDELGWIETSHPPSTDADYQTWQDQKIKHTAEIRKLISAMADIRVKIYHVESVEKALAVMYEEIGRESIETQKRIRDRLQKSAIHLELDG